MSGKKRRGARPNARFFMLIGAVVLFMGVVGWLLFRTVGGTVEAASVTMEAPVKAVIIRDETVVTAETYGNISYAVAEGERITSGTKICEVYKWGTYDSVLADLLTMQQEIRDYQVKTLLQDIVNTELTAMDSAIDAKLAEIAAVASGESTADMLKLNQELKTLMNSRRDYLKSKIQPDDRLMSLYEREQTLLDRLQSWKQDVYSQNSGMVSFYFDGYESVLNRNTMAQVLPSDINAVINGKAAPVVTTAEKPLYRVMNTSVWYLAVVTGGKSEARFVQGESYDILLDGNYDKPYTAVAESISVIDGNTLTILRVEDDVAPVAGARVVSATVRATFTGTTVASRAVVTVDGQTGVYITENGERRFVPVTVLYSDGKNAAVRPLEGYVLNVGDSYSAN
ncbi:MAG: HlyD family efflux transporter periplasmic adaptor subunit [Christensenellales bacterium]|jgi:putative membrane fusion protein